VRQTRPVRLPPYDAVVLAGGRSTRFGGDKLAATVDGVPLLDRVLASVASAQRRIVVGEPRPVAAAVEWARENPPGGGPAAGVVAGLERVRAERVVLLAGDLPYVGPATVRRLLEAGGDGALLVDAAGRRQLLCSTVRTALLRAHAATRADWTGASVRELLADLALSELPAAGDEALDVDTPEDLEGLT
jgi:molybdopterin-guanine dinucleotide biosynthesis protein A